MINGMNEVIDILTKVGAFAPNGHFVGTSGFHFDTYINKDCLYTHTKETSYICKLYAEKYKDANIEVVVGPALGGIILSQWVAYHLSNLYGHEVLAVYTEKTGDGGQVFTRGYDKFVKGKRVLVVEDNVTTGDSILKVVKIIQEARGNIISICAMVNRNKELNGKLAGVPFDSLSNFYVSKYSADDCSLCKAGVPINITLGHGKKFLEKQNLSPTPLLNKERGEGVR